MFRKFRLPLGRLLSLLLASVALTVPVTHAVKAAFSQSSVPATESCFVGVDFASMSATELTDMVTQTVLSLRGQGLTDEQIVSALGTQLGSAANGCSSAQVAGLFNNVALILQELGFTQSTQQLYTAIYVAFNLSPGAFLEPELLTRTATVY